MFGLSDIDVRAMGTWLDLFAAADYTAAELNKASDAIAYNPSLVAKSIGGAMFLGKLAGHLASIRHAIRELRAVEYQRDEDRRYGPDGEDRGTCTRCQGTGRVIVPHLCGVNGRVWSPTRIARGGAIYYTMAVLCPCPVGLWYAGHTDSDRCPMRLEAYAAKNPAWQAQLAQRDEERRALTRLDKPDEKWAAAVRRVSETANQKAYSEADF